MRVWEFYLSCFTDNIINCNCAKLHCSSFFGFYVSGERGWGGGGGGGKMTFRKNNFVIKYDTYVTRSIQASSADLLGKPSLF